MIIIHEYKRLDIPDGIYAFTVLDVKIIENEVYQKIVTTCIVDVPERMTQVDFVFTIKQEGNKRFANFLHSIGVKKMGEPYILNIEDFYNKIGYVRFVNGYPVDFIGV